MKSIFYLRIIFTLLLGSALSSNFAMAQEDDSTTQAQAEKTPGPPAEERSLMQIEIKPDPRIPKGKSAFIHGETDAIGDKFLVEGIDVMQPVYVGVYTKNADDKIRVRIVKDNWDKSEREANTDGTGKAEFTFRTYDSFKIGIDAKEDTEYQIVVWVGDEIPVEPPAIAVAASDYVEPVNKANANTNTKKNGVSLSYLELGLIGFLLMLLIGIGVAFVLFRKKK